MVDRTLRLTRAQIRNIVGDDPDAIRQFERLFAVADTVPASTDVALSLAEVAATAPVSLPSEAMPVETLDWRTFPRFVGQQGRQGWEPIDGTLSIGMAGNVLHRHGLNSFVRIANNTGGAIAAGELVAFSGVPVGGVFNVVKFIADGSIAAERLLGFAATALPNGALGFATAYGPLDRLNTSAFSAGDVLYASAATAGAWTTTPPTSPNIAVFVGAVLSVSASEGRVWARPCCGSSGGGGGGGTVTSVAAGTGLSASPSPITGAGTLSLANTTVTPGSYLSADITVDAQGRLTAAARNANALVPPSSSVFTTAAGTAYTGTFSATNLYVVSTTNAQGIVGWGKSFSGLPKTIIWKMDVFGRDAFNSGGLWLKDSAGKYLWCAVLNTSAINRFITLEQWSARTAFSSSVISVSPDPYVFQWFKVEIDTSNDVRFYYSADREGWIQLTTSLNTYLGTIDGVGLGVVRNNGSTQSRAWFYHYEEA